MALTSRNEPKLVPSYSLTADLLSYLRCGLQYRYQNGSSLPPARPVQLWFGEFIHGVLEMAFTLWKEQHQGLPWNYTPIPWESRETGLNLPTHDIGEIGRRVEAVLAIQGKIPRNRDAREAAYERAAEAINVLGPHLFPLVVFAEEPLEGSRPLQVVPGGQRLRADRYAVTGVADVLTHISLASVAPDNIIRRAIEIALQREGVELPPEFEVIVDYKGAGRPDVGNAHEDYWQQHDWQIQMYSWLRARKRGALPVAAGIIMYVNELLPSTSDVISLRRQIGAGLSDIVPARGSDDYYAITTARPGTLAGRELSEAFRISRTIRVIPVTPASMEAAGRAFDGVVQQIEGRIVREIDVGAIDQAWEPTCQDGDTCVACDFRYFCPRPHGEGPDHQIGMPPIP